MVIHTEGYAQALRNPRIRPLIFQGEWLAQRATALGEGAQDPRCLLQLEAAGAALSNHTHSWWRTIHPGAGLEGPSPATGHGLRKDGFCKDGLCKVLEHPLGSTCLL